MASDLRQVDAFIAYPTNRVVCTIADPKNAQAAIEALLQAGFTGQDIEVLHTEEDLHRPSPGSEHTFLEQFQRTLIRALSDEYHHLRHYVDDVRAGRTVIMVLAKEPDRRETAADILGSYGAQSIEFYGRWSWQSLEPHPAPPDGSVSDPAPGRTYAIEFDGTMIRARMDSLSRVTIFSSTAGAPALSRLPVTYLKPHLLMLTWQDADRTTHVHVYDFETNEAHAVVTYYNRSVHRARGTIRRWIEPAPEPPAYLPLADRY